MKCKILALIIASILMAVILWSVSYTSKLRDRVSYIEGSQEEDPRWRRDASTRRYAFDLLAESQGMLDRQKHQEALDNYLIVLRLMEENSEYYDDALVRIIAYHGIGQSYLGMNDLDSAESAFADGLELCRIHGEMGGPYAEMIQENLRDIQKENPDTQNAGTGR